MTKKVYSFNVQIVEDDSTEHDIKTRLITTLDREFATSDAIWEGDEELGLPANAKLIAAAPELLVELRMMAIGCCGPIEENRSCHKCAMARAAITKATT